MVKDKDLRIPQAVSSSVHRLKFDEKTKDRIVYQGHIIMSRSEGEYLHQLIESLSACRFSTILEVGFGLGIVSGLIQDHVRPLEVHDIIEIELQLYEDCHKFCLQHASANAILGDFYSYDFGKRYDLLFYDPYDYTLADQGGDIDDTTILNFQLQMTNRAKQLLVPGGILCHPFFGNVEMPKLDGFRLFDCGSYSGPPFVLWDGTDCEEAQCGYYKLQEYHGS